MMIRTCFIPTLAAVLLWPIAHAAPEAEALAQSKARLRQGLMADVQQVTGEIDGGVNEGKRLARLLRERGVKESHLLMYDKAIEDFSRAIDLDGFNPQFYQDRAVAYLRAREFDKADADLGMLLGIDNNNFSGLREKGRTAFYRGKYLEAADFFLRASQNADQEGRIYSMLWVSIAAQRGGKPSPLAIQMPNAGAREQWPIPVAELYTGSMTPEQVMQRAEANNPRAHLMLQCEAQFYLGEYYLIKGDKEKARSHFNAAIDTGITDFMEYDWAVRELEMLDSPTK